MTHSTYAIDGFLTPVLSEKHLFMNLYENRNTVSGQNRPVTINDTV